MNKRKFLSSLIDCQKIIFASVSESSRLTSFSLRIRLKNGREKTEKEKTQVTKNQEKKGKL